ncbi:MAG: hypothetical protein FWD59_10665, partial [Micrococcales bacterium]|nr:hypothetical protein [Micrococcales bacterium]
MSPATAAGTTFANTNSITLSNPTSAPGEANAAPYPSSIAVSGLTGTVSNLTVTLSGIHYSFSQDISALLVSPTGQSLVLFSSVGSNDQATATNGLNV